MPENENIISPLDLQFKIRKLGLTQRDIAQMFNKTDGAISGAINGDPLLVSLRKKIIVLIKDMEQNAKAS